MNHVYTTNKVDFLIAGTQKGGTSALDHYLRDHPEICMAHQKELHFFDNELLFAGGTPDYLAYQAFFSPKTSHRLLGEATPIYMYWHDAPRRIWHYNPDMKLIIILRNPIDRAFSHWNMMRDKEKEPLPFWEAIRTESERCRLALPHQHRMFSYIDRGFYAEQLRRIWAYFQKSQTLILRNEDLRASPKETLDTVCRFLEVDSLNRVPQTLVHARPYTTVMSGKEWEYLRYVFEYDIRALERMLDWDCSEWLREPTRDNYGGRLSADTFKKK